MPTRRAKIKNKLLQMIVNGQFQAGSKLPTIRKLAEIFQASPATIQSAVNDLKSTGVLDGVQGKGVFIHPGTRRDAAELKTIALLCFYREDLAYKKNTYPGDVLVPFKERLQQAGYIVKHINLWQMDEFAIIAKLREAPLAGIALFEINDGHMITELKQLNLPMICMDYGARQLGVPSVFFSNTFGAFQAISHLIEYGHRDIIAVTSNYMRNTGANPYGDPVEDERLLGYNIAMRHAGLEPKSVKLPIAEAEDKGELNLFLAHRPNPTAVFACNGLQLEWVAKRLLSLGYVIPTDISIIGFNCEHIQFAPKKYLSSIHIDCATMGDKAAEIIVDEIKNDNQSPSQFEIFTKLIQQQSVSSNP